MIYIFEQGNYVLEGSTISEEERSKAIVVAERPLMEHKEGKRAVLKWDVETQTAWYEYVDIPKSDEDKITQLENENLEIKLAMADLAETYETKLTELQLAIAELAEMGV